MHTSLVSSSQLSAQPPDTAAGPRTTADELLALATADRVQYLRLNRRPDGQLVLGNVDGLNTLSKERREELMVKISR